MLQRTEVHPPLLTLVIGAALIAFTVSYSVDAEPLRSDAPSAQPNMALVAVYEPPTLAPSAIVLNQVPAFRNDDGVVKFFFAPSSAELVKGAEKALSEIVASVKEGRKVQVSGFHDETGNSQQNAALAKKRALAVQKHLLDSGVPAAAVVLEKPAVALALGSYAEARRVEVRVLQ